MPAEQDDAISSRQGAWHQSSLELLSNCSWRYFLTYKLGLADPSGSAARVGTAVHSAVELHEKARLETGEGVPVGDMLAAVEAELPEEMVGAARMAVHHWYSEPMADGGPSHREWLSRLEPVLLEPYFRVPLVTDADPIGGWIDGVYRDPSTGIYMLVDLKTANNLKYWPRSGEGKRHQATVYSVALQISDLLPEKIDYLPTMTYTVVKTGHGNELARRVGPIQPDLDDVRVLGDKIRAAEALVRDEAYTPNPSWHLCSSTWCAHYEGCQITGELSGSPVEVRSRVSQI